MKRNAQWQQGLGLLTLRLFAAYEFFDSGLEKWNGENWFAEIHDKFPFPFHLLPDSFNWQAAMWAELVLPVLLVIGLATRLSALGLMIVTWVAWVSVHAGLGYNIGEGGYKMALIYLVVLFPILLQGAGVFSVDFLIQKRRQSQGRGIRP